GVQTDLGGDDIGQDAALVNDCRGGLVTRSFEGEQRHFELVIGNKWAVIVYRRPITNHRSSITNCRLPIQSPGWRRQASFIILNCRRLGGRHLIALGQFLLRRRGAGGKKRDAFEQVQGAVELGVVRVGNAIAVLRVEALNSTGRALEQDVALFLVGDGNDNVGRDPLLVDDLVAGGVVLGGGQAQSRAVRQRQ